VSEISLVRNDPAIGFSKEDVVIETMVPFAVDVATVLATLIEKVSDLETIAEGKVTKGEVKTEISFGSELVKIQGKEVVVVGNFTVVDIANEQNGTTSGQIDASITRIIGDLVQTGAIISNNFSGAEGTSIDLDNETITMGGSVSPKFFYDGAGNLTMSGVLDVGSIITSSVTIDGVTLATISTDSDTGATHAVVSGSNPHNTPMSTITGDLDDIADGVAFFKSTADQNSGGTRGFNALDSSFDYIRSIQTTNIVVSGSNPTNGIVIDSDGLRGFSGGALSVNISTAGDSTWSKDIVTSGSIFSDGSTTDGSDFGVIVANPTSATVAGFRSTTTAGQPAFNGENTGAGSAFVGTKTNTSTGGAAFTGVSADTNASCLSVINTAGGDAIVMASPKISGDVNFLDDVDIDLTLIVGGNATFNGTTTTLNSALVVSGANTTTLNGAVTINDTLSINGIASFTNSTQATSTSTGAVVITGGIGVAKNAHIGGTLTVAGVSTFNGTAAHGTQRITKTRTTGHTIQFWTSPGGVDQGSFEYEIT